MKLWTDPVDALGQVRQEIRALQAREKQLREQLLREGYQSRAGACFRMRIEDKPQKRFDKDRLPAAIRDDPAYWRSEMRTYVRTFPIESAPQARAPQPLRRAASQGVVVEDDYDVIEDWPVQNKK